VDARYPMVERPPPGDGIASIRKRRGKGEGSKASQGRDRSGRGARRLVAVGGGPHGKPKGEKVVRKRREGDWR